MLCPDHESWSTIVKKRSGPCKLGPKITLILLTERYEMEFYGSVHHGPLAIGLSSMWSTLMTCDDFYWSYSHMPTSWARFHHLFLNKCYFQKLRKWILSLSFYNFCCTRCLVQVNQVVTSILYSLNNSIWPWKEN